MPKFKKRKPNAVQTQQSLIQYTLVIRSRRNSLAPLDAQLMRDAFITNEQCGWELTSNCKVKERDGKYRLRFMRRNRPTDKVGKRIEGDICCTIIQVENNAFDCRYKYESKKSKDKLDIYKSNLRISLGSISIVQTNDDSTSTTMHLPPPKRKRAISKSVLKSYAMSGSLTLNLIANKSMNPRNCPPNSSILYDCNHNLKSAAETIQIFARKREIRHAEEMMKRTILDQTYRVSIIKYL